MKITNFFKSTLAGFYHSLQRFPVSIALSTSIITILIIISEIRLKSGYNNPNIESLDKIAMVLFLGFLLSLCIKLLFERYTDTPYRIKIFTYIASCGVLIGYYFILLKDFEIVSISRYVALSFALLICFLFVPSLGQREHIELYIIKIFSRFFITIIYSVVLYLGLAAILFTLDKLLNIPIHYTLYYYTWLITAGIFAPIFFLAEIPHQGENLETYGYPKFFKILLLYIVMPLITVYLTILYIYSAKIIITTTWPVGLVSHLVLWYSAICVGVLFLISPIKNNAWVDKFTFFIPKLILPILVMMFTSMGIRIKAYGITENRYYVVILGLWVLCVMLYINITKIRKNIILPISLAIVSVACVFGPLSSFSVSKWSQNNRFTSILTKNGMIVDGKLNPKEDIPKEDKNEISRILSYFKNTHNLKNVNYLNDTFALVDMKDTFGFAYTEYEIYANSQQYFSYYVGKKSSPIEIIGYDYLFDFRNTQGFINQDNLQVSYTYGNGKVKVFHNNIEIYDFPLSDFATKLQAKYPNQNSVNQEDMIFEDENQAIKAKFVFSNIDGFITNADNNLTVNGGEFFLLLKLK